MGDKELDDAADLFGLTPCKTEVCRLRLRGLSYLGVARALGKSVGTVRAQVHDMYKDLGVNCETGLCIRAFRTLRDTYG